MVVHCGNVMIEIITRCCLEKITSCILRFSSHVLITTKLDMAFCEVNIIEYLQPTICHIISYRRLVS